MMLSIHKLVRLFLIGLYALISPDSLRAQTLPGNFVFLRPPEGVCDGPIRTALLTQSGELWLAGNFRKCLGQNRIGVARFRDGALLAAPSNPEEIVSFVNSMVEFQGEVYLSGRFRFSNTEHLVARVRNQQFEAVGYPKTDSLEQVGPMTVFDGALYLGGDKNSPTLKRFDGQAYTSITGLPPGPNPSSGVYALQAHNGELFVAGSFTGCLLKVSGNTVVAPQGGTIGGCGWRDTGITNITTVWSMASFNDALYFGGTFSSIGALPIRYLARWQNGIYEALTPGGLNDVISGGQLLVHNGELLITATFNEAGNSVRNIVAFNGTQFRDLGISGFPNAGMTSYGNQVLFTGDFSRFGSQVIRFAALWDGINVTPFTPFDHSQAGPDAAVRQIVPIQNGAILLGDFTTIGSVVSAGIAKLSANGWQAIEPLPSPFAAYNANEFVGNVLVSGQTATGHAVIAQNSGTWQTIVTSPSRIGIAQFQNQMYFSGTQITANQVLCDKLMRWNGSSFACVNTPSNFVANFNDPSPYVFGSELAFAGPIIQLFDGSQWRPLQAPPESGRLSQFRNQLVWSGDNYSFRFNGNNWVTITARSDQIIAPMPLTQCEYQNDLYSLTLGSFLSLPPQVYNGAQNRFLPTVRVGNARCAVADNKLFLAGNADGSFLHTWQSAGDTVFADNFE